MESYKEKCRKLPCSRPRKFNRPIQDETCSKEEGGCRKMKKPCTDVFQRLRQKKKLSGFPLFGFWLLASSVTYHLKKFRGCCGVMKNSRLETEESLVSSYFSIPVVPPPTTATNASAA
ncbi:hypothetical protein ACH5RR_040842 [Cinchona calisaya]|uniref:Transmembrane protein n=1 Tax=Cinchona calisaya TaxID=153742 RepID=A0ABD2XVB3_9GENT